MNQGKTLLIGIVIGILCVLGGVGGFLFLQKSTNEKKSTDTQQTETTPKTEQPAPQTKNSYSFDCQILFADIRTYAQAIGTFPTSAQEMERGIKQSDPSYTLPASEASTSCSYVLFDNRYKVCKNVSSTPSSNPLLGDECRLGMTIVKLRDQVRKSHLSEIQLAVELFYDANQKNYPESLSVVEKNFWGGAGPILNDPFTKNPYVYSQKDSGKNFELCGIFESYGKVCTDNPVFDSQSFRKLIWEE